MLNWTERIIRMRKDVPEIGWGDFRMIATRDPAICHSACNIDPLSRGIGVQN
jgi:hypothetical protein